MDENIYRYSEGSISGLFHLYLYDLNASDTFQRTPVIHRIAINRTEDGSMQ